MKNETGGIFGACGRTRELRTEFWWENPREREHLEDLRVNGRLLKWIFNKHSGGVEWISLVRDRDKWRALLKTVMKHFD